MINYKEKPPARKRIGVNPEGESGPGGPPSDHRERVRCGKLKKGTGSFPSAGINEKTEAKRADSAKRTPGGRQATKGSAFDEVKLKQGPGYDKREV